MYVLKLFLSGLYWKTENVPCIKEHHTVQFCRPEDADSPYADLLVFQAVFEVKEYVLGDGIVERDDYGIAIGYSGTIEYRGCCNDPHYFINEKGELDYRDLSEFISGVKKYCIYNKKVNRFQMMDLDD